MHRSLRRALALSLLTAASLANAATPWVDIPGGKDHPLISRFEGSWLVGYQQREFDAASWPAGPALNKSDSYKVAEAASQEGRITRIAYVHPRGKTPLEAWRNHEQALAAAGFQRVWACERDCDKIYWAWRKQFDFMQGMTWLDSHLSTATGSRYSVSQPVAADDSRLWVGKLARPDGSTVMVQFITAAAVNKLTESAATWIQIVEPKAMQTGQVTVDARALQSGLAADGKVALYGLFFDTGKADIKPDSKPQLDEMAKVLQGQPALKVFIVGHTDNVGAFDTNQTLSLKRAEAVVAALAAAPYKIDAKRLQAKGAANIAPVASNTDEAGRARNRRVELVAQ